MEYAGVAISTTSERLAFLEATIWGWRRVLPLGSVIVVTVDGSEEDAAKALEVLGSRDPLNRGACGGNVVRVGQGESVRGTRMGVAVNKNTGIEYLMDAGVESLFLSDDDTYPLSREALDLHTEQGPHSMVCWGRHRQGYRTVAYSSWKWPRGVMLYLHRSVVEKVGGMREEFGPGGHEHVEFSRRVHNAGLTPTPFIAPAEYAHANWMGARDYWHAEDMPRAGEWSEQFNRRKTQNTTVLRRDGDWAHIDEVMARSLGSKEFVPYTAAGNGREPATMTTYKTDTGRGAENA